MSIETWSGWANVQLENNATTDGGLNVYYQIDETKSPIFITWEDGKAPPGRENSTISSDYLQGYLVTYQSYYQIYGYRYVDAYKDAWIDSNITAADNRQPPKIRTYTNYRSGLYSYWQYTSNNNEGQPDVAKFYKVVSTTGDPVSYKPTGIGFSFGTTSISGNTIYEFSFTWWVNVRVTRDCTVANIANPVCVSQCLLNPKDPGCYLNYKQACLDDPSKIGSEPCKSYYEAFIAANGSNGEIDPAVRKYCEKYKGFNDLFQPNSKIPEEQRLNDLTICACNLTAPGVSDPDGTVLYNNYFNSIAAKYPSVVGVVGQEKCLLEKCRSSTFLSREIPQGGCKVPDCFIVTIIENDGTANNITVKPEINCNKYNGGDTIDTFLLILVIVVVIVVVIVLAVVYFTYTPKVVYLNPNRPLPRTVRV